VTDTATVSDPAVAGAAITVNATAGAPFFNQAIANFSDPGGAEPNPADPAGTINGHYALVSINWGDATPLDTTTGQLSFSGMPGSKTDNFTVSGSHTYAASGSYTITVVINHEGVMTTLTQTINVSSPGPLFQGLQTRTSGFWNDQLGQELLRRLTKTNGGTGHTLGQWLASTFPKLYGAGSPNNLMTFSNSQIGTYYKVLFNQFNTNMLDAEVLSLALYIYATTSSLGGTAGSQYNLHVDAIGLGAYLFNIGFHGAAFGVANGTVLDIFHIMLAANNTAVGGEAWDSNLSLRNDGLAVIRLLNGD
jgi:PKD repeat protein